MSFIHSRDDLVSAFLKAMGVDPAKTRRVTIDFEVNAAVVTVVEMYVDRGELTMLTEEVRKFKLVPIDEVEKVEVELA